MPQNEERKSSNVQHDMFGCQKEKKKQKGCKMVIFPRAVEYNDYNN
jgi:hypothetical protein